MQCWHFFTNRNSSTDFWKKKSFEYVDSWPKSCFLYDPQPNRYSLHYLLNYSSVANIFIFRSLVGQFLNKVSKSEKLAVKCICQGELSNKPLALFCQNQFCPATFHFIFNKQTICCAWQIHVLHCKFLPHENTGTGNHMVPAGKTCTSHKNMKIPGKNNLLFISYKN